MEAVRCERNGSEKSDTEYSYALEFYDALSVSSLEGVSVTIRTGVNHRDGEPVSQFYSENSRENLSLVSGMYTVQISKEGYVDTYETIFVLELINSDIVKKYSNYKRKTLILSDIYLR